MRSRGSWQPVDRPRYALQKPGDSRNDCRLLYLRVCEGKGYLESARNLELQLSLYTDSSSAKAIATDEDAMAARTCSSKTLTSCIRIKSCRHVDESTWKIKN